MFLTLTNVGMIMRPDLFEQHTIHFHGYPNASCILRRRPRRFGGHQHRRQLHLLLPRPGCRHLFWHCHITPPEHLQMGMVGQLYVRPRQNACQAQRRFMPRCRHSREIFARLAIPRLIFYAAILASSEYQCHRWRQVCL